MPHTPRPTDRSAVDPARARRAPWLQVGPSFVFEWNVVRLPIPALPAALQGLRIVHVTDLHLRRGWLEMYDELLERLRAARPDLILVTGDFVDNRFNPRPALPTLYRLLDGFRARLGCYGILGNHDRYHMSARLQGTNVRLIDDRREVIRDGGGAIELIGLPGVDRDDLSQEFVCSIPPREASGSETNAIRIVLSHFPNHLRRTESLRPDLFLAGHTHGGQICLPGGIPILRHDTLPRRLCRGVHRVGPTWLVVSRGLGTTGLPVRLFCPPEVIEIECRIMQKAECRRQNAE